MVERPVTSGEGRELADRDERLPPSSTRTTDFSAVVMWSRTKTSSLKCRGWGAGSAARATVTVPASVVTTPTPDRSGPGRRPATNG
jgi:hypothetical protein